MKNARIQRSENGALWFVMEQGLVSLGRIPKDGSRRTREVIAWVCLSKKEALRVLRAGGAL